MKVAAGDAGHFTDQKIDPFGTYKYRLNAGGKFSNVVTVGPPPGGVSNAAPAPKSSQLPNYGPATAVAFDENGDPVIAFEWLDPNGDGDKSDTEIRFVRWDRASYKWMAPVRVAITGPVPEQNVNSIAVACDRDNDAIAILTPKGEDQLLYALSTDHGATWKTMPVPNSSGTPHATAMAIRSGQVHVVVNAEEAASYFTGPVADVSSWKKQAIPAGSGWKLENSTNTPLTLDAAGSPALAFYENQQDGDEHRYAFWRPGGSDPVAIVGIKESVDGPNIALTFGNGKFGALLEAPLDAKDTDHGIWYSQSTDGSSWSKPTKLPIDGPRTTNPPSDVAISSEGAITAVFSANSGTDSTTCNYPVVSRSSDGTNWKTCGLGKAEGGDFSPQPSTLHVIEAGNDKAYIIWQEQSETKYGPGVLVWHER